MGTQIIDVTALVMSQTTAYLSEKEKIAMETRIPADSLLTVTSSSAGIIAQWVVSYEYDNSPYLKNPNKWVCKITEAKPDEGFRPFAFTLNTIADDIQGHIERRQSVNNMHKKTGSDAELVIPTYTITVTTSTPDDEIIDPSPSPFATKTYYTSADELETLANAESLTDLSNPYSTRLRYLDHMLNKRKWIEKPELVSPDGSEIVPLDRFDLNGHSAGIYGIAPSSAHRKANYQGYSIRFAITEIGKRVLASTPAVALDGKYAAREVSIEID